MPGSPRTRPIAVAVVDDQQLLVSAFSSLITAQEDMEVVLTAANGQEAVERLTAAGQEPGPAPTLVVLMDLRMPIMDGVSAIAALRGHPDTAGLPILVLTTFDDEELVLSSLRAGANGFLLKDASPQVLLQAIRVVAQGGSWLDPAVTGTVLAHLEAPAPGGRAVEGGRMTPDADDGTESGAAGGPTGAVVPALQAGGDEAGSGVPGLYEPLTRREEAVLALVCQGLANAGIAQRLYLAESTVKTHVKAILGKTGCTNRVELIIHAFATGLVPLPGRAG
ncbi:response regulator transcription factor [Actinomyces capricornis]|nr:response regulator transcription factor [Actinomyces capricornis]